MNPFKRKPSCPKCGSGLEFVKYLTPTGNELELEHVGWTAFCESRGQGCGYRLTLNNTKIKKIWEQIKSEQ